MNYRFSWPVDSVPMNATAIEEHIARDLNNVHSPIRVCHEGEPVITFGSIDTFKERIVGRVQCTCGAPIGIVRSNIDGSNLTLSSV